MVFYSRPPKKRKEKKTIYTGKLPTSKKKNKKSFWIFILITTTSMEIKLTNFLVFLKVYQTYKKKARKREFKLAWIIQ